MDCFVLGVAKIGKNDIKKIFRLSIVLPIKFAVMYRLFRSVLFLIEPERIHGWVAAMLRFRFFSRVIAASFRKNDKRLKKTLFGVEFSNPVGMAAGFDKDARMIDGLGDLGFGFIEIGTLTPRPQPGNPKPRLFRLRRDEALINRMGFNNEGVERAVERLARRKSKVVVGGNIGKNKDTPNESAIDDYLKCFDALHAYVDYFVLNVSSPNTPGLRALQEKEPLEQLLRVVKSRSESLASPKPVLLKIAPDLTDGQLDDIVDLLKGTGIDGVIATNTTISREGLETPDDEVLRIGAGGLSGRPLRKRSTEVIRYLREKLGPDFPIIGVGGIMTADDAIEKLQAGADLIQLYTGFIYEGPALIGRIHEKILQTYHR